MRRLFALLCLFAGLAAQAGGPHSSCPLYGYTPARFLGPVTLNYDQGSLGTRSRDQSVAIVDNARAMWNNVSTASVVINRGTDLPADVTLANFSEYEQWVEGRNIVVFDNDGSLIESLLGVGAGKAFVSFSLATMKAFLYPQTEPCQMLAGYVIVNDSVVGGASDVALTNAVAHEIGHVIGLDHTQLGASQGLAIGQYPIMYPKPGYRNVQSLHEDDIAAVSALYPDNSVSSAYGTVTGRFVKSDGTPIFGANIWTRNEESGQLFSYVSDALGQGSGAFSLLLPPGTYRLRAEAISKEFTGRYNVGPYSVSSEDWSFLPPLYSGSTPMAPVTQSLQLHVVAGCTVDVTFRIDGSGAVNDSSCLAAAPAELISPAGAGIQGPVAFFQWTAGTAVAERFLMVGTTRGGSDIYAAYQGGTFSRFIDHIPVNGETVYVRLMSYANGQWLVRDYSFIAPTMGPVASVIVSPPAGAVLAPTTTFQWSLGAGITERYLTVGTIQGGTDIYSGYQGSELTRTVAGIPATGGTIHVVLSSTSGGTTFVNSYTYQAPSLPACSPRFTNSRITAPARDSTLSGASVMFTWDAGCDVTERYLAIGSTQGGSDIYGAYQGAALSRIVNGMPTDGRPIYVTLSSWLAGAWVATFVNYTAFGSGGGPIVPAKSNFTSPAVGSTLVSSNVMFQWDSGVAVSERYLALGSTVGASDIYAGYQGAALSRTVSVPTDGRTIYAILSSWVNGGWQSTTASYTAASGGPPAPDIASVLTSPGGNFTLGGPSETFVWTAGTGVFERYLMVGTTLGGSQIYAGYQGSALSRVVPGMPAAGSGTRIYVRLMSFIEGSWLVRDRQYTVGP